MAAIKALGAKKFFVSSGMAGNLVDGYLSETKRDRGSPVRKPRLTAREREIVQLLAEGRSNKEVAGALRIAVKTVETHRTNILHKLNLHSVAEIVRYAVRNKIVPP
jgi:DNA-binding NarL/FixJ family response regulator